MDGTNSGSSNSNLIILSPEELAKLGLNLLLPDKKTENSIKVESISSSSKKHKHIRNRKLETSISNPSAKLPTNDSNSDEPTTSLKPRRGRHRKSEDNFNESSANPRTSEISNTSQTRDTLPAKIVKDICFKKPVGNMLTAFLSKKASADLKTEKLKNDSIHLEEEKRVPKKSSKTCPTDESEPTVVQKCLSERTYEGEQDSCEQIMKDLENPEVVKPINNTETMKTFLKQEDTDENESIPVLGQGYFIRQKQGTSFQNIESNYKGNEFSVKDKSSPNKISTSSTTNTKKDVIVLSNTPVSFTQDELKHLIYPIKILPIIQRNIINKSSICENTTSEVSVDEENNMEQSDHVDISERIVLENNTPKKEKQLSFIPMTKIELQETIFDNTSHERETEEKNSYNPKMISDKFKVGYSKIVEKICQTISDAEPSRDSIYSEKDLPTEFKAIGSTSSTAESGIPSKNHKNSVEHIPITSTVYAETSNLNEQDPVSATLSSIKDQKEIIENNIESNKSAENNSSNKNKKLRRSRIVYGPKIIKQSTPRPDKALIINKQINENQVETKNVVPHILNETANILPGKNITKNIEPNVAEFEPKEDLKDIYNASSINGPLQSIISEKQSPYLSPGKQLLGGSSNVSAVEAAKHPTLSLSNDEINVPLQDESATFNMSKKSKEIEAGFYTDESLKQEESYTSLMTPMNVGSIHDDPSDTGSENFVKNGFDGNQHADTSCSISKSKIEKKETIIPELNSSSTNDKKNNNQSENQNKERNLQYSSTYTVENLKSTPMKKQGRKRKNSNNQSKMETPILSYEMELSTSGRKRRKVNYYEIINDIANDNQNENAIVVGNDVESKGPDFTIGKIEDSRNFTSKKRGRPKKNKVELLTNSENDQANQINKPLKLEKHLEESESDTNEQMIKCDLNIKEEFKFVDNAESSNTPLEFVICGVDDFNENSPKHNRVSDEKIEPSESDMECKKEISICYDTPTPLKKRGRKRKDDHQLCSETIIQHTTGRRGEQVDYSENVDAAEGDLFTDNATIISDSIFELETTSLDMEHRETRALGDDLMSIGPGGENDQADWMAVENTPTTSKSKYTFNGQTSMMMHSIFSAAFKDTLQSNSPEKQKTKRGRPRSNANSMVLDEEGKTFCVICEEKIPHTDWQVHNRFKHYNLAWCEGQDMLAIDDDSYVKKRLGYHSKKKIQLRCYKCDHSSTTVLSYIVHLEECRGILVEGMVVCAICNLKMERDRWLSHKLKHNNLAWRIGDVPMDLNNQSLVVCVLNALYKAKKPLNCEKCGTTKKSVVGYISHRSQCGVETEKAQIECEICFKKMLPVSMITHLKGSHGPKEQKSNYFDVIDAPLKKRRAATNALSMFDRLNNEGGLPYFLLQMDFKEHSFVIPLLENELKKHQVLSCKYKNCKFQVDNIETLLEHMANCSLKPNEYYTCTKCLSTLSQDEKKDHLKKCLNVTISDNEDIPLDLSDDDEKQLRSRKKPKLSKTTMVNGVTKEISYRSIPRCIMSCRQKSTTSLLFPKAFKYTLDFCQMHYNQANILNNLRYTNSDWCLLNEDLMDMYLPKMVKSCRVAWKRVKNENGILREEVTFKEFEIFEHLQDDQTTTIFCGGPISALAWMPTPYQTGNCNQILAVATYKDYDEKYSSFKYYNEPSVIQFWDFGMLRNKMKIPEPKLYFCLAVDFGPIWNLEWCPSGCYDEDQAQDFDMHRKGVLAVSGSVPSVYIYAIPVLEEEQTELIYKVKPLLKLQLVLEVDMMKRETYPSKMSWSKAQGHKHLAVGYTDGTVGIFNLATDSHLLKFKDEVGIDVILPYKIIKAHKHCITALTLIHLNGGARWLFTGSFDRYLSVWDLTNDSAYITTSKRVVSDAVWLTNWVSYVAASDESGSINAVVHGFVNAHRNYLSEPVPLLRAHSTISSISFSDWLNACLQSSSEGEICLYLPSQLLYGFDNTKYPSFSYYLNTTYLIDTTKTAEERMAHHEQKKAFLDHGPKKVASKRGTIAEILERSETYNGYEPLMFEEASDRYGILFCDFKRDKLNDFPIVRDKNIDFSLMKQSSPDRYPLQAITKISFNPNCYSSLYFAAGYQAGFVRLNYLKFLENDAQVKI